jgi:hypothetical protein
MALAVLMHSKWTMASDHAHKVAADFAPGKRSHSHGAGPIPVPLKYRSKHAAAHMHGSSSVSPPRRHHNHRHHHPHAQARAARMQVKDDPVRDGVRLAYDNDARLPSDRKENMITVGGDLSEGLRQWDAESDLRLGDIVHDGEGEPAYTVAYAQQRRRGRGKRKGKDGVSDDDDLYDYEVMDGWESDDDAAISLADGWAEMESWRDLSPRAEPTIG